MWRVTTLLSRSWACVSKRKPSVLVVRTKTQKGMFEFRCDSCGKIHSGSASFSQYSPEHVFDVPEDERETSHWMSVTLDIPTDGANEPFCWGVWVSQSREAYERYVDTCDADQSEDGSFGWLPLHMAYYRKADGSWPPLKCSVNWSSKGQRPKIELQECDEQLYPGQRDGISWEKAIEIAAPLML